MPTYQVHHPKHSPVFCGRSRSDVRNQFPEGKCCQPDCKCSTSLEAVFRLKCFYLLSLYVACYDVCGCARRAHWLGCTDGKQSLEPPRVFCTSALATARERLSSPLKTATMAWSSWRCTSCVCSVLYTSRHQFLYLCGVCMQ